MPTRLSVARQRSWWKSLLHACKWWVDTRRTLAPWQSPFLQCLKMHGAFMFPVLVRRWICYLLNCKMHLCQFRPLFGRRLTTEVGVWGPGVLCSAHVMLVPLLTLKSRPVCRGLTGSDVLDILRLSILRWLYYVETMLLWKSHYARCHLMEHYIRCKGSPWRSSCAGVNYLYSRDKFEIIILWRWPLICFQCWGLECLQLYHHTPLSPNSLIP
jgi:hypothetical protein